MIGKGKVEKIIRGKPILVLILISCFIYQIFALVEEGLLFFDRTNPNLGNGFGIYPSLSSQQGGKSFLNFTDSFLKKGAYLYGVKGTIINGEPVVVAYGRISSIGKERAHQVILFTKDNYTILSDTLYAQSVSEIEL